MSAIYLTEALSLLEDGKKHMIKHYELRTGEAISYDCIYLGKHVRRGLHRVRLCQSKEIRAFRDITLITIDEKKVYL